MRIKGSFNHKPEQEGHDGPTSLTCVMSFKINQTLVCKVILWAVVAI